MAMTMEEYLQSIGGDPTQARLQAAPPRITSPVGEGAETTYLSKRMPEEYGDLPRSFQNMIQNMDRESLADLLYNIQATGAKTLKTIVGEHPGEVDLGPAANIAGAIHYVNPVWPKRTVELVEELDRLTMKNYPRAAQYFEKTPINLTASREGTEHVGARWHGGRGSQSMELIYHPSTYNDSLLAKLLGVDKQKSVQEILKHEYTHGLYGRPEEGVIQELGLDVGFRPGVAGSILTGRGSYLPSDVPNEAVARLVESTVRGNEWGRHLAGLPRGLEPELTEVADILARNPQLKWGDVLNMYPQTFERALEFERFIQPYKGGIIIPKGIDYTRKEVRDMLKEEVRRGDVGRKITGGKWTSRRGGGSMEATAPKIERGTGNYAVVHLPDGDVFVDITKPESWPDKVKAHFKKNK